MGETGAQELVPGLQPGVPVLDRGVGGGAASAPVLRGRAREGGRLCVWQEFRERDVLTSHDLVLDVARKGGHAGDQALVPPVVTAVVTAMPPATIRGVVVPSPSGVVASPPNGVHAVFITSVGVARWKVAHGETNARKGANCSSYSFCCFFLTGSSCQVPLSSDQSRWIYIS